MDQFQDRLARLTELTPDEITALETEMVAAFDATDAAGDVETMQQLADALDEVRAAGANAEPAEAPDAEAAAVAAAATDIVENTDQPDPEVPAEEVPVPEEAPVVPEAPEVPETPEEVADVTDVADLTVAQVAEAAGQTAADAAVADAEKIIEEAAEAATIPEAEQVAPTDSQEEAVAAEVTSEDVPVENQPELVTAAAPFTITAGGDIPGFTAGQTLDDMDQAIDALTSKVNNLRGVSGEVRTVVASLKREFDEDKMLRRSDPTGNSQKVREIVQAGRDGGQEALVAAGWCAPKTPIYDHVNGMAIGVTDTPVLDSFASLGVDRGGIVWQPQFSIGSVPMGFFGRWANVAAAGAAADYRFTTDGPEDTTPTASDLTALAGGVQGKAGEKPCITIPCPPEAEAELGAVPMCLCTDVLMSRANPEFIRHFTDLVMVAQARYKEQWALAWMDAVAKTNKSATATLGKTAQPLGACRDILLVWRVAAANFRWENRLSPTQELRVYAPSWLRDAMAADLTVQMPGDDTLSVSYAIVEGYISDLHLKPVWYIDDPLASVGADNFDSMEGFAKDVAWYMDLPGVIVHMDGGSLDLGVQRTKEDIVNNRFCEFAETFDGLAYMGPADSAWLFKGKTLIEVRGGFAPAVATTASIVTGV